MLRPFSLFWIWSLEYVGWTTSFNAPLLVVFATFYLSIYISPHSKTINPFFTFLLLAEELIIYHNTPIRKSAMQCTQRLQKKRLELDHLKCLYCNVIQFYSRKIGESLTGKDRILISCTLRQLIKDREDFRSLLLETCFVNMAGNLNEVNRFTISEIQHLSL
jgi:hypothetical protein